MKHIVYILFLLLGNSLYAQQTKFNISGGLSLSQIDNDRMGGYNKNGFTLGLLTQFPIKKNSYITFGLKYVNKGSKRTYNEFGPIGGNAPWERAQLHYMDIPLTYHYIYKNTWIIGTGPTFGILLGGNIEFNIGGKSEPINTFKRVETAWHFVFGYKISEQWRAHIISQNSIISANKGNNHLAGFRYAGYTHSNLLIELVRVFDTK